MTCFDLFMICAVGAVIAVLAIVVGVVGLRQRKMPLWRGHVLTGGAAKRASIAAILAGVGLLFLMWVMLGAVAR